MKIREDRRYRDREGREHGPLIPVEGSIYAWACGDHMWTNIGSVFAGRISPADLIAEVDEPEPKGVKMGNHTPTPWGYEEGVTPFYNDVNGYSCGGDGTGTAEIYQVDEKGNALFDAQGELMHVDVFDVDNAGLIVRAVNSHEALVEALEEAERFMAYFAHETNGVFVGPGTPTTCVTQIRAALSQARS